MLQTGNINLEEWMWNCLPSLCFFSSCFSWIWEPLHVTEWQQLKLVLSSFGFGFSFLPSQWFSQLSGLQTKPAGVSLSSHEGGVKSSSLVSESISKFCLSSTFLNINNYFFFLLLSSELQPTNTQRTNKKQHWRGGDLQLQVWQWIPKAQRLLDQ